MKNFDIIIIGGGAAGMMASISASTDGASVAVLEKNQKLGKKIYITGKGRCNVTNASDISVHLDNLVHGKNFMRSAYSQFDNNSLMELLSSNGLELKVERGNRVFPASDKAYDVTDTLQKIMKRQNVKIEYNTVVIHVRKDNSKYILSTSNGDYTADSVIVTTGGNSYSSTGSDGYGYKVAQQFGHTVVSPFAGLSPIRLIDDIKALEGLSLKNVRASVVIGKEIVASEFGEMIFTRFGVSGPIILTLSSKITRLDLNNAKLVLDLKPALSLEKLDDRLLRDLSNIEHSNKQVINYLRQLMPSTLIQFFIQKFALESDMKVCNINKVDRAKIVTGLKNFELKIMSVDDIESAVITSGGINLVELNPKTMESKLSPNLYFAGEVIDVDALTGGYNLQVAFSTGYVAGKSAACKLRS